MVFIRFVWVRGKIEGAPCDDDDEAKSLLLFMADGKVLSETNFDTS